MKTALICGVSGQDGSLLARFLLQQGYRVFGSSRDAQVSTFSNLHRLGIYDQVNTLSMTLTDFRSVFQTLRKIAPDEIYNLAGQSSVGLSFEQPVETLESITLGTLNLLEAIRFCEKPSKLYNAGSSESFGDTNGEAATEQTPFHPRSPYAVAKAAAFWEVANYREAYGLHACSGILFNHESPLRPERFVTRKIVANAHRIATGKQQQLKLGNLKVSRDWGWAPEYVEAMWRMLQQPHPDDYVIATGKTHSLEDFVRLAFEAFDLDWQRYVVVDPELQRTSDIQKNQADPSRAKRQLGWQASVDFQQIITRMAHAERLGLHEALQL